MPAVSVKIMKRSLPSRHNPMLEGSNIPPYNELVEMRRLGQTNLGTKSPNDANLFSYVHLRAPLPQPLDGSEIFGNSAPESYFLMRRSQDGFVSSTGMFKASFPWAKKKEEDLERQYVREHFAQTSNEETAGNLWVHPTDALTLADDYGMRVWIEALLDNEAVVPSDHRKRNITPPPPYFKPAESDAGSVASSTAPATRRRSTRSASPSKRLGTSTPRKTRSSKAAAAKDSPLKKSVAPITETDEESVTLTTTETTTVTTTETVPALTNGTKTNSALTTPAKSDLKNEPKSETKSEAKIEAKIEAKSEAKSEPKIRVEVDEEVETKGDVEVHTTHVKLELPATEDGEISLPDNSNDVKDVKNMIAKAQEMVDEARKLDTPAAPKTPGTKRKAEEIATVGDKDEDDVEDDDDLKHSSKKSRLAIEEELKREKVKIKALIGLTAVLAIGALFPYVL
ncbi:uncharacterized protein H6S33_004803 [Morchella sextelata]|uniref:uncharacterized protein n=1 Tax=Morchella sextelata TaxID=1174677 RepID=UPI001D04F070|nr:uncharacterized protein H6S33_004803 [Morchella sextelata]KAH0605581.1 hypothetical protein H6S33_004803 [Morchella sextelata]